MPADDSRPAAQTASKRLRENPRAGRLGRPAGSKRLPGPGTRQTRPGSGSHRADARMALIVARYGKHLDDDAHRSVQSDVEAVIRRGNRMRAFELSQWRRTHARLHALPFGPRLSEGQTSCPVSVYFMGL